MKKQVYYRAHTKARIEKEVRRMLETARRGKGGIELPIEKAIYADRYFWVIITKLKEIYEANGRGRERTVKEYSRWHAQTEQYFPTD